MSRNDKIKKKWLNGFVTKANIGGEVVIAHSHISCDGNSRMIEKSTRGAKKFVRTRIRSKAKIATRKLKNQAISDIDCPIEQ